MLRVPGVVKADVSAGSHLAMVRRTCFGRWQDRTLGSWRIVEFLPCGLLYSALLVASLTGKTIDGAIVMALFALGASVSMMAGLWLWLRLRGQSNGNWGVRLAELALTASSAWALWMGFMHDTAPWCITPA